MKNTKTLFLIVFISNLLLSNQLFSQNTIDAVNIQTVINLTKFIKYSNNSKKNSKKKILYIITDENTPINFEIQTRLKFNYKDWLVICSETINNIPKGSVIFLMTKKNDKIKKVIKISQLKELLTISNNIDGFCLIGGMINIKKLDNNVKFEINYKKVRKNNMQISSKLLALAKIYD